MQSIFVSFSTLKIFPGTTHLLLQHFVEHIEPVWIQFALLSLSSNTGCLTFLLAAYKILINTLQNISHIYIFHLACEYNFLGGSNILYVSLCVCFISVVCCQWCWSKNTGPMFTFWPNIVELLKEKKRFQDGAWPWRDLNLHLWEQNWKILLCFSAGCPKRQLIKLHFNVESLSCYCQWPKHLKNVDILKDISSLLILGSVSWIELMGILVQ